MLANERCCSRKHQFSLTRTLVIIGGIAAMACGSNDDVTCPADLRFRRLPADTTISVGMQF